jgi:5-oxoprolinase (ATP-hydrolysing) subunit A
VRYVKPHGALYNVAASSPEVAAAVVEAVRLVDPTFPVLGLAGSQLVTQAGQAGVLSVAEAFADRAYTPEGLLVSRRQPGSVLHDPAVIAARCVRLVTTGTVEAVDGSTVTVFAQSLCVHGDTPGAVAIAQQVRSALLDAGVTLAPFTGGE